MTRMSHDPCKIVLETGGNNTGTTRTGGKPYRYVIKIETVVSYEMKDHAMILLVLKHYWRRRPYQEYCVFM